MSEIGRSDLTRPEVMGIASGVFFMALFGALWGMESASFVSGGVQIAAFVLVGVVTLGLVAAGAAILRYAMTLPDWLSPQEAEQGGHISTYFGIVFGIEFVLIAVVAFWLSRLQAYPFIPAAVALIVGLHFFPLARLFHLSGYWITGALLCALALVAIAGFTAEWRITLPRVAVCRRWGDTGPVADGRLYRPDRAAFVAERVIDAVSRS
jgi:hypothetical protein